MSTGLLQGLAERTLGLARPLRSCIAARQLTQAASADSESYLDERSMPAHGAASSGREEPVRKRHRGNVERPHAPALIEAQHHAAGPSPDVVYRHEGAAPVTRDMPSSLPAALVKAPADGAGGESPRAQRLDLRSAIPWLARDVPTPLLPPQQPRFTFVAPALGDEAGGRRTAVTRDMPNEVHVSIGRVELTAVSPKRPSAGRPEPQKVPSRSLEDYLRPRDKGPA